MKPFRHEQQHDVKVEIPTEDIVEVAEKIGEVVIVAVGFYMAADTLRHILKAQFK